MPGDEGTTAGGVGSLSEGAPPKQELPFPLRERDAKPSEDGAGGEDKKPRGTTPGKPVGKPDGSDSELQDPKDKEPKDPKAAKKDDDDEDDRKHKPRGKRKVTRGGKEEEIDFDDDEGLMRLLSDAPKHKVKVDGEEREITIEEALKDYELRSASNKRMEAATIRQQQLDAWPEMLRQNPQMLREFLRDQVGFKDPFEPLHAEFLRLLELQELAKTDPNKFGQIMAEEGAKEERFRQQAQRRREDAERAELAARAEGERYAGGLAQALADHQVDGKDPLIGDALWRMYARAKELSDRTKQPMPKPSELVYELKRRIDETFRNRNPIPDDPEKLIEMIGEGRLASLDKYRAKKAKEDERRRARGEGGDGTPARRDEPSSPKTEGKGEVSDYMRELNSR